MPTFVRDNRHGFAVVAREHAGDRCFPRRLGHHPITDFELQHFGMRPHLLPQAQTRDDTVVEVHQIGLGLELTSGCD
jgi:hypothetical protein